MVVHRTQTFKEADFLQRKCDIEEASWVAYSLPQHVEAVQSRQPCTEKKHASHFTSLKT